MSIPRLHLPVVSTTVPSASMTARSKKASGCCPKTRSRSSLMTSMRSSLSAAPKPRRMWPAARGARMGCAAGAEGVEVGLVVAEPFEVVERLAAGEEVVGEVEDVVGLEVGDVALEEADAGVEGVGELEALGEELEEAQAGTAEAPGPLGGVEGDVGGLEHARALAGPRPLPGRRLEGGLCCA